mgnify:CR=1 FL=1
MLFLPLCLLLYIHFSFIITKTVFEYLLKSKEQSHRCACQQNRWAHGQSRPSKSITAWKFGITISWSCDHQWKVCECSSSLSVRAGIPALWPADYKAEHGKLVHTFGRGIFIDSLWLSSWRIVFLSCDPGRRDAGACKPWRTQIRKQKLDVGIPFWPSVSRPADCTCMNTSKTRNASHPTGILKDTMASV